MIKSVKKATALLLTAALICTGSLRQVGTVAVEAADEGGVYKNGIAQIFVTTSGNSGINLYTDTSKTKVNATIVVKTVNGEEIEAEGTGTINVRGNSTSLAQKKPYNFKFENKQDLFGMGKAKKWSLLANTFDKSLVRTQVGMRFQASLEKGHESGDQFTSECEPVDLYIDGKYLGTYLLIESVETGSTRVDIDVDYLDDDDKVLSESVKQYTIDGSTYKLQDMLLEVANDVKSNSHRYDDEAYYLATTSMNVWLSINEPERNPDAGYGYQAQDNNKPEFVLEVKRFLDAMEAAMKSSTYPSYAAQLEAVAKYIDLESFVDFYIT